MELEPRHRQSEWTTARSGNRAQPEDGAKGAWGGGVASAFPDGEFRGDRGGEESP